MCAVNNHTHKRIVECVEDTSCKYDISCVNRVKSCRIQPGTTMARCYGTELISERHRHRYEFNNDYRDILQAAGLTLSGLSPDGSLVETVELSDRPFFVGVQYHPEFKSRPNRAHPLFRGFIAAALEKAETR